MKISTAAILVACASVTSFVLGSRYGAEAFIQADAKFTSALITAKLSDLDTGNLTGKGDRFIYGTVPPV